MSAQVKPDRFPLTCRQCFRRPGCQFVERQDTDGFVVAAGAEEVALSGGFFVVITLAPFQDALDLIEHRAAADAEGV